MLPTAVLTHWDHAAVAPAHAAAHDALHRHLRPRPVAAGERRHRFEHRLGAAGVHHHLAASGALQRYVASLHDGDRRAAEAYYWLGVIESRVGRSFWLSQTEPYLEAAIRLAPDQPIAELAYSRLEEFVVGGYTGSSGEHVPPDVKAWLEELQQLIRRTRGEDRS